MSHIWEGSCPLTPERMEEICKALEDFARSGGKARSVRHSTGPLRTASMTANMASDTGIPYEDLWQFRQHATPDMKERIILAGKDGKRRK